MAPAIREIRVLPALVAAQIAAGEVVERPASVVRELVDNALDAGAARVSVEIEQGGIELVRVSDDGHGVSPSQLALMVAPHATSKVRTADDLDRITTLGFRGEALASITSVSRISIRSRTADDAAASLLEAEGDRVEPPRPDSGPVGTVVTIRNLFFNTPARRKFLRTPTTEQGHCVDSLRASAMAHPNVGFVFKADGRTVLELPPGQSPRERAIAIVGPEMESQYLETSADQFDDIRGAAIWGMVALPALARPTNKWQHLFINGRPVRDKTIQHALKEAYRGLIEPGRHPAAVLMIEMDPGAVDVNVHPAKSEVRFRDPGMIHALVYRAVRRSLEAADLTPHLVDGDAAPGSTSTPGLRLTPITPGPSPFSERPSSPASDFVDAFRRMAPSGTPGGSRFEFRPLRELVESQAAEAAAPNGAPVLPEGHETHARMDVGTPPAEMQMAAPVPAPRILQVHNSYLVTQDEQGIVIIDQHALHERVMFEKLLARVSVGALETQRMLMPLSVGASPGAIERLPELAPLLERLGMELVPLGAASVGIQAFPSFLLEKRVDPGEFVAEMLEKAEAEPGRLADGPDAEARREAVLHEVLDMMACKAAIKAGDSLSPAEREELLTLRETVDRSSNCPHGRPTALRLSIRDIERSFGRS